MTMLQKRCKLLVGVLAVALVLSGCGGDNSQSSPTATLVLVTPAKATETATTTASSTPTSTPAAVSTPTDITTPRAVATDAPAEYELVSGTESEPFPTPDLAQKQQEMQPTAVIIDGEYPYPTANSAIDSNGDGFYEIPELEQAVRETYPPYVWPDAYHPTIDEVFEMMDFNRVPPGARFQVPMEVQLLGNLNSCAWKQNWLDAFETGDQAEMDKSMKQLRTTVLTNPTSVYIIPTETEMFNKAELGDPALMIRDVELNCYGFNNWVKNRGMSAPGSYSVEVPGFAHALSGEGPRYKSRDTVLVVPSGPITKG